MSKTVKNGDTFLKMDSMQFDIMSVETTNLFPQVISQDTVSQTEITSSQEFRSLLGGNLN